MLSYLFGPQSRRVGTGLSAGATALAASDGLRRPSITRRMVRAATSLTNRRQIPAGLRVVAQNTFYRDFVSTTELAAVYEALAGAPVHYVSGGPWQLYRPLARFLVEGRHPEGSFHMKRLTGGSSALTDWTTSSARWTPTRPRRGSGPRGRAHPSRRRGRAPPRPRAPRGR